MKKEVKIKDLQFSMNDVKLSTETESDVKSFSGTAYSGLPIMDHPYWGNLIFDTSTVSSQPSIPVLFNHDPNRIVGFGSINSDGAISIEGKFSKTTDEGRMVAGLIEEGFPMKESVYIEPEFVQTFSEGQRFEVNGQQLEGPFTVFRNSTVKEVSMTPLPADINTETSMFSDRLNNKFTFKEQSMSKEIVELTNEQKFQELVNKGDLTGAFEFACSCEKKDKEELENKEDKEEKKESTEGTTEFSDLESKFEELLGKYNELVSEGLKKERFSEIKEAEANKGFEFSETARAKLSGLSKEDLTDVLAGIKVEKKVNKLDKRLFSETGKQSKDLYEFDEKDPDAIYGAAMKFKEEQAKKGIIIKDNQAVVEFLRHQSSGK